MDVCSANVRLALRNRFILWVWAALPFAERTATLRHPKSQNSFQIPFTYASSKIQVYRALMPGEGLVMGVVQNGTFWNTGKKMFQLPSGLWHGSLFRRGGFFGELPCRKAGAQQFATICNQKTGKLTVAGSSKCVAFHCTGNFCNKFFVCATQAMQLRRVTTDSFLADASGSAAPESCCLLGLAQVTLP